ncbi:DUF6233 domain-containing protein [Streptomyces sp. NPDC052000]|uniref:DUF6233 domain-containing protein n=1 Tax=Streptomyces sp. NPDC052000 TaxID=3155676 RepID=UPI00344F3A17
MSEPSRLDQLHFLRRYLLQELAKVDGWIAAEEAREAKEAARREPPPPPDWVISTMSSGRGPLPQGIHTGACHMAPGNRRPITREQALTALSEGVPACEFCRPDTELGWLE